MKVTIKEVARIAGVSVGTVSMVINNRQGVNKETRKKVMEIIQRLNYRPNQNARSLITNKSSSIGLIVTNISNPFFGSIVDTIQGEVERDGYNLVLGISSDQVKLEKKSIEQLLGRQVEGLIIVPTRDGEQDLDHLYELKNNHIPFVFLTSSYKGIKAPTVMTDLEYGSYELTNHLIKRGDKKIYFLTDYKDLLLSSERIKGYRKAFMKHGIQLKEEWIIETFPSFESAFQSTEKIIQGELPEGIICINDMMAMGVIKCLKDHGIRVPDDISVAGFDDLLFSSIFEPPLTTIKQPLDILCKESIHMLFEIMQGKTDLVKNKLVQPELMVRLSTK